MSVKTIFFTPSLINKECIQKSENSMKSAEIKNTERRTFCWSGNELLSQGQHRKSDKTTVI